MTIMRLTGLIIGGIVLALLFKRLRMHSTKRIDVWSMAFVGAGIIAVSIFPGLMNVPADLLFLDSIKGGRIMALLVLSVAVLFYITLTSRNELATVKYQLDRFIQTDLANKFIAHNSHTLKPETILILMPAWNEEENLPKVLPQIPKEILGRPVKVLVINDGSRDGTAAAALNNNSLVVTHPFNRGGGAALRTGYAVAEIVGTEILVTMDADGQHKPEEIEPLVAPIVRDEADFVIGSRMLGSHDNYSRLRIAGVHFFNRIINTLMGTNVTDCASGFRAIRFSALGKISLLQDQYHTSELIIDAAKKGLRITERPIHIAARIHGYSKKGGNLLYAFGFLRTVLVTWWR